MISRKRFPFFKQYSRLVFCGGKNKPEQRSLCSGVEMCIRDSFYSLRKRDFSEILPWDFIDIGVTKEFLMREAQRAYEAETTPNCKEHCSGCGAAKMLGRKCDV